MKLLIVMTHYPFPPRSGSAIVACNSMKYLSRNHRIDFIGLKPESAIIPPAEFLRQVELVPQERVSRVALWMRYLRGMLACVPYSIASVASPQMQAKVKEAIRSGGYDVILLFEMSALQYCPPESYDRLIIHIEDPASLKLSRMAQLDVWSLWQKTKLQVLAGLTAAYERRLLPQMKKVLLLSAADREDMRAQGGYRNLAYMPYAVEAADVTQVTEHAQREQAIVFSGNMYHPPNVDGALWFLREVFPMILRENQAVSLWIVGADPDARMRAAATAFGERVQITGRVDNIAGYIKRACVSICPVRLKIGVQTKILEALSCGTPVVTRSAGNSGVGGVSGVHLWVEDEPARFARKVGELLRGQNWEAMQEAGRKLAAERFSWETSVEELEKYIQETRP